MINGIGVALRRQHFQNIIQQRDSVPWLEVLADQFLNSHGILIDKLQTVIADIPCVMHCVGMSLAGCDPLEQAYLDDIKRLSDLINPAWISDHLSVSKINGIFYPELLPCPLTDESLQNCCERVNEVQHYLQKPLLLENPVQYAIFNNNTFTEPEFFNRLCAETNCAMLLDVNNLYVNQCNHGIDAEQYIDALNPQIVKQMHIAGHSQGDNLAVDTHGQAPQAAVIALYQYAIHKFGKVPTCLEWDRNIPSWDVMQQHCQQLSEASHETC